MDTTHAITRPDLLRGKLWCHVRENEGRMVRYCFMAKRITEPGVERC
jgi:hypothetical protein